MSVMYYTTPGGEEIAVLPRAELEAMKEAAEHARAVADYRSGRVPGLTLKETRAMEEAPSLLAFWRKYRGKTQVELATEIGIAQNYLSEIENGRRTGDVSVWLHIGQALDLPVEVFFDED
jgi:DNA-binding XRE family transcriptional regulator